MASKASTWKSAKNFFELPANITGYSLKKHALKRWIYDNDRTQPFVARHMSLPVDEFKRRLCERGQFNRQQLWQLIKLMGAAAAFDVIYFPTKEEKRRVYSQVFAVSETGA